MPINRDSIIEEIRAATVKWKGWCRKMSTGIYETELPCVICGAWFKPRNNSAKYCEKCRPDSRRFGRVCKQRFSGKFYKNTAERIEEIKEKYADGIPDGTVESMVNNIFNRGRT